MSKAIRGPGRRLAATLAAAAMALAACGGGSTGGDDPDVPSTGGATGFQANISLWVLPLDSYQVAPGDSQFAISLLYSDCMTAHGFDVPAQDPADYLPPARNQSMRKLFNLGLAQEYGYHPGPTRVDPASAKVQLAPDAAAQDRPCVEEARSKLKLDGSDSPFVTGLASNAASKAQRSDAVINALAAWRACMLPLGVPDLPEDPSEMPTVSQRSKFGFTNGAAATPDAPPVVSQAGPAEIEEAVFDAQCRESSGYAQARYDGQVNAQLALIEKNKEELSRILGSVRAQSAVIAEVLRSHGR